MNGNASIEQMYSRKPSNPSAWLVNGKPLDLAGTIALKIDHIEKFIFPKISSYVTFLESINLDHTSINNSEKGKGLSLPGDVSEYARENKIGTPVGKAIFSDLNRKVTVVFIILSALIVYLSWSRLMVYETNLDLLAILEITLTETVGLTTIRRLSF